jgi:hypothetical protein
MEMNFTKMPILWCNSRIWPQNSVNFRLKLKGEGGWQSDEEDGLERNCITDGETN